LISDLITQKAGIEGQRREMVIWEENERREREDAKRAARERVVKDFERGMALGGISGRKVGVDEGKSIGEKGGKFEFDGETVGRVAKEAEEKAGRMIESEQVEARRHKLAAFWLPSLTPEAKLGPLKDMKLETMCHVGGTGHPISYVPTYLCQRVWSGAEQLWVISSRKTLLPVIFTYPTPTSKPICPSCSRELINATPAILLSSRSPLDSTLNLDADDTGPKKKKTKKEKEEPFVCGHVVCKTCADTIVKPSGRCSVCEAGVTAEGMIPLEKEGQSGRLAEAAVICYPVAALTEDVGTGFAAAGGAEVKKSTIAFRV